MIALLLDIYVLVVWLVFLHFKLLPFDLKNKIAVGVGAVVFVFGILLVTNFLHPQSLDARVFEPMVQIASRNSAPARVTEVRVSPNTPIKAGAVLFVLDPRSNQAEVARLEAALAEAEQNVPQLKAAYGASVAAVAKVKGQLELSVVQEARDKKLASTGAGSQEDYDKSVRSLAVARDSLTEAEAQSLKAKLAYEANTESGENVQVAQIKAELEKARIDLEETIIKAPADGHVTNLQVRPGMVVRSGEPVMSFLCDADRLVVVTMPQQYVEVVKEGDEVEVCLKMYPGKTLHGKVESVILSSGAGQLDPTGELPTADSIEQPARFPIKVQLDQADIDRYRLPAGAHGAAAIYSDHLPPFKIVRRVMLRWYTWLNYISFAM